MGQRARLGILAGIIPAANILFFSAVFLLGLNSDEHRKYDADLLLDKNPYMERLERRARGFNPERGVAGERDFKADFLDVLRIRQAGHVPSTEMARLLQEKFLRPIRDCLDSVYSRSEVRIESDASDAFSRAIAHILRDTGTIQDTTKQEFIDAAARGKIYWKSCPDFVPGMEYLVDGFRVWEDLLLAERRAVFARRVKAIVDRLFWDNAVLTMDRAGASKADIGRAYQAIDKLTFEVKGACLDASQESDVSKLLDQCHRSRDTLLEATNQLSRFVDEIAQTIEQSQLGGRRTVEDFFRSYVWQIAVYFVVLWLANIVVAVLALKWKMVSDHNDHPPEVGSDSGAPPRPTPVPGHGLPA